MRCCVVKVLSRNLILFARSSGVVQNQRFHHLGTWGCNQQLTSNESKHVTSHARFSSICSLDSLLYAIKNYRSQPYCKLTVLPMIQNQWIPKLCHAMVSIVSSFVPLLSFWKLRQLIVYFGRTLTPGPGTCCRPVLFSSLTSLSSVSVMWSAVQIYLPQRLCGLGGHHPLFLSLKLSTSSEMEIWIKISFRGVVIKKRKKFEFGSWVSYAKPFPPHYYSNHIWSENKNINRL